MTYEVSRSFPALGIHFQDYIVLKNTNGGQHVESLCVTMFYAIHDNADNNFLPRRATLAPKVPQRR